MNEMMSCSASCHLNSFMPKSHLDMIVPRVCLAPRRVPSAFPPPPPASSEDYLPADPLAPRIPTGPQECALHVGRQGGAASLPRPIHRPLSALHAPIPRLRAPTACQPRCGGCGSGPRRHRAPTAVAAVGAGPVGGDGAAGPRR